MLGEALSLACALTWALAVILFKRSDSADPQSLNLFKNLAGLVLLAVTIPLVGTVIDWDRSAADWARLAISGVLGIAVGDTLFFAALRRIGPGLLAIIDCSYAPQVVLFSVLVLGEQIGPAFALGGLLVVGGVLAAVWQPGRRLAAPTANGPAIAMATLAVTVMAASVVIAKPVLDKSDLFEVTFIRLVAGTLSLGAFMLFRRDRARLFSILRPQPLWRTLIPAAFLGTYVAMLLWLGGMKYAGASVSSVLSQTSVVFTLLLARVMLGEALTGRRILAGGVALAGAVVILAAGA